MSSTVDADSKTTAAFTDPELHAIASQFAIPSVKCVQIYGERGNINLHTFEVETEDGSRFLLQRLNNEVFAKPLRVMAAMEAWIDAQSKALAANGEIINWVTVTLVGARDLRSYVESSDRHGESVWRMMVKIPSVRTYKSLSEIAERSEQVRIAEECARGLAISGELASNMPISDLQTSLPGYRDTAGYFRQFRSVIAGSYSEADAAGWLPEDPELREATRNLYFTTLDQEQFESRINDPAVQELLDLCRSNESFGLELSRKLAEGDIRTTAIHGDTKIDNFLFCTEHGTAKALIDLDTIMPYTWLADWGDMVRSLCNPAGEKEADLTKIQVDEEIYEACICGFLKASKNADPREASLMHQAVETIALELGVRFLTDYLRGDNYFAVEALDPQDLNLIRARVQLTLFQNLRLKREWANSIVQQHAS